MCVCVCVCQLDTGETFEVFNEARQVRGTPTESDEGQKNAKNPYKSLRRVFSRHHHLRGKYRTLTL